MYLNMNGAEFDALLNVADPADVRSIQLSRRDALDNPMEHGGALVVSVVTAEDQFRVAIGETGSTIDWGAPPECCHDECQHADIDHRAKGEPCESSTGRRLTQ